MCTGALDWDHPIVTDAAPTEPRCASAWIDPIGKFYPVPDCGHHRWAEQNFDSNADALEKMGWVHLSYGQVYTRKDVRQAQLDTLFDTLLVYRNHGYFYADRFAETFERLTAKGY